MEIASLIFNFLLVFADLNVSQRDSADTNSADSNQEFEKILSSLKGHFFKKKPRIMNILTPKTIKIEQNNLPNFNLKELSHEIETG